MMLPGGLANERMVHHLGGDEHWRLSVRLFLRDIYLHDTLRYPSHITPS
jgi:hypothetical protein